MRGQTVLNLLKNLLGDRRPVTLVGVNFRTAKRNIDEPLFAAL